MLTSGRIGKGGSEANKIVLEVEDGSDPGSREPYVM